MKIKLIQQEINKIDELLLKAFDELDYEDPLIDILANQKQQKLDYIKILQQSYGGRGRRRRHRSIKRKSRSSRRHRPRGHTPKQRK